MSKIIAVLALACVAFAHPVFAAESSQWNKWNVSPYANSFTEACQKSSQAIDGFDMPLVVKERFKSTVGSFCKGGREVWLTPGMPLEQMWSGKFGKKSPHLMNKKSVGELPVTKSPDGWTYRKGAVAETARAYSWEFVYEGKTYVLYLPFVCFNWSWALGPPVPISSDPLVACYKIPLDYRQTQGVVLDDSHAARIKFHLVDLSGADLERLSRDPCFKVSDATGIHVPYHLCEVCESSGGQWPSPDLAKAVGFPEKEPSGVFTAPIAEGVGTVFLPHWAIKHLGIYCVDVEGYMISVQDYAGWTAVTRFDLVTPDEMRRTLPEGKLDRALSGAEHY